MADFNPGIGSSGLFWTQVLSWDSGHVQPGAGEGTLHVADLPMPDFGTVGNALFGSPIADGVVTVDVDWDGPTERHKVTNAEQGWTGQFFTCGGNISWSGERTNGQPFAFHTTTQEESVGDLFFFLAHERNGAFFQE